MAARLNTTIDQALPHLLPNHNFALKSQAGMQRLSRNCGDPVEHPSSCRDVFLRSQRRPRLLSARPRRAGRLHARELSRKALLRGRLSALRRCLRASGGPTARGVSPDRDSRAGGLPPALPGDCPHRPPHHGGERHGPPRNAGGGEAARKGARLVRSAARGYLIGISHVDPLEWDLTLERFISEDATILPDIDLDFPRGLRDELIERVHSHFGPEYAVLTGAVSTYKLKGIIQDLGKALGLPQEELKLLSKQVESHDPAHLRQEMLELPGFRDKVEARGWRGADQLAPQLANAPRMLGQHVGGMILSSSPIPEMVPTRAGAMDGRFIMDWNKDSVADAGFAKIDILSLPVLDQIEEALDLIERREGTRPDLGRVHPEDARVYDMINAGRSVGVFLLQSPAQLKMGQRLRSRSLLDLAYQVALIRPGVGVQGSAVSQFVDRYRHGAEWEYDHPLEARALERGCGIIVWQEQVVQLIKDVAA